MRILVVYGTKMGGTAGLAEMIGEALQRQGMEPVVMPASAPHAVDGFDAVVIAGAVYNRRWHPDARAFVRRNVAALKQRPVWLVASGPLDDSTRDATLRPIPHVASAAAQISAQGTVTFGGRLSLETAKGFPARAMAKNAMAKKAGGDWREPGQVAEFAEQIARTLATQSTP